MTEDLKNLAFEMQRRGIPPRYFAAQRRRGMSSEEIIAAWPVQTRVDRIGSRRSRRLSVVGAYGGWLLAAVLSRLFSPPDSLSVIALVLLANAIALLVFLNHRTYLNREVLAGDSGLDERLVQNRNHAFRVAYQVFALVVLLAWATSAVLERRGTLGLRDASLIYQGVALLGFTLPAAVWLWREPDPAEPEPPKR
jgi:uncharacterized membrane protein